MLTTEAFRRRDLPGTVLLELLAGCRIRNHLFSISVALLIFILALPGCSSVMEAYREQTVPSSERPIQCKFVCPVPSESGPARRESRLDSLVVIDLRGDPDSIGSMYSANGSFNLTCMHGMSFERILDGDLARILDRHSIAVGGAQTGGRPTRISLYVDILEAWVASRATGLTEFKVPIEASVTFRTVLQDDERETILWEAECRGRATDNVWYSFSRHHAASLEKAYCKAIQSFETAIGSEGFLQAIRR